MFYSSIKALFISVFLLIYSIASAQITITEQPDPATVCAGTDVTLTTAATGDTGLAYQWQLFNSATSTWNNITDNAVYNGANTTSLSINTNSGAGSGQYRCIVSGDVFPDVNTNTVIVTVNARPAAPDVVNVNLCIVTLNVPLTAVGGTNGQYRWYTNPSGGTPIPGETDNIYIIPLLNLTTTMYVSINNGICESERVPVSANLLSLVPSPTVTNGSACEGSPVTLTAAGGNNGEYRWYTSNSILATPISGATNSTYTPPTLPVGNTIYYVALNFGPLCESLTRSPVTAQINPIPPSPQPINASSMDLVCGPESVTLSTSGGIEGDYQWYENGVPIAGAVNETYSTTPMNTTVFEVANKNGTCESLRQTVTVVVRAPASNPILMDDSACRGEAVTFIASGAVANEEYHWYEDLAATSFLSTGSTFTTSPLTISQGYFVRIINTVTGCMSNVHQVNAIMLTPPAPPTVDAVDPICSGGSVTFIAHDATNGQYRWYTQPTGGSPIAGETNNTYTISSLTGSTTVFVSINNGTCESDRVSMSVGVVPPLLIPTTTSAVRCGEGSVTLQASGGLDGNYLWYTAATGGLPIAGESNSTFITPTLSTGITTYYVSVAVAPCETVRVPVTGTVNALPNEPTTSGGGSCNPASVTLNAFGATNGQYRWYIDPALGTTPIHGQVNSTFTTPSLSVSTTYYVSIDNGVCESTRTPVTAIIAEPGCDNVAPVIQAAQISIRIGGLSMINLNELISDENNDQDLTTLTIFSQPNSGAVATIELINGVYMLVLDYANRPMFSGSEDVRIGICDSFSACTLQIFSIQVDGEIEIFNALSPNGDAMNAIFRIEHIATLENTRQNRVTIFNRWGDLVWEGINYDNETVVFAGQSMDHKDLPTGTYYYIISFTSGRKRKSGFISLKR